VDTVSDFRHIVEQAFRDILRREPGDQGIEVYGRHLNEGMTEAELREILLRSDEFKDRFPDTPPPPPPSTMPELRYEFPVFTPEIVGATVCCDDPDTPDVDEGLYWGWPLVRTEMLDKYAEAGINLTELRPGPFRNPSPEALLPELTRTVRECEARRQYALIGLIDHWGLDHDETPWGDGLEITARAPEQRHKDWIRQVIEATAFSPAAVYFDGNESFKGSRSNVWIFGVYDEAKIVLTESNLGHKLVGSNSGKHALDFQVGHGWRAAERGEIMIESDNEPHSPEDWLGMQRRSRANGGHLLAWKGPMSDREWFRLLPLFGGGNRPVPSPTPCGAAPMPECGQERNAEEGAQGIWGCCRSVEKWPEWCGPSEFRDVVNAVLNELVAERGIDVPDEAAFTAEVARRLRLRGLCATTRAETPLGGGGDEVGVKRDNSRSEQFDVIFANGRVRFDGYVAVCRHARF